VLSLYWSAADTGPGLTAFLMLLLGFIPMTALAGAAAGLVFCPLAQWLVGILGIRSVFWPVVQAAALALLTFLTALPLAAWVAGSVSAALDGKQGSYILLVPATLAGVIGGALFGHAMRRYSAE
jgi:hypothetical protein